jgi:hypothetical protein
VIGCRLHSFLAHLVTTAWLSSIWEIDGESDGEDDLGFVRKQEEAKVEDIFRDGTWAGTLLWDSAVHTAEFLLTDKSWQERIKGSVVVELGSGLGLPGVN